MELAEILGIIGMCAGLAGLTWGLVGYQKARELEGRVSQLEARSRDLPG